MAFLQQYNIFTTLWHFCNILLHFSHIVFLPHYVIILSQLYIQSQVAILQQCVIYTTVVFLQHYNQYADNLGTDSLGTEGWGGYISMLIVSVLRV